MVQPIPPGVSANRPERPGWRDTARTVNINKYEEFSKHLRQPTDAAPAAPEPLAEPAALSPTRRYEDHQMGPEEAPSRTLAPDEQSGWGRGCLDPAEWLSAITSAGGAPPGQAEPSSAGRTSQPELSELVEGWVRRLSVGGDQRRAVARLDIGHGAYAGAELVIAAEGGAVEVELTLPEGAAASGLSERLTSRLSARGYAPRVTVR